MHALSRCPGCKLYCYCDRECQRKHWNLHRRFCSLIREREDELELVSQRYIRDDPEVVQRMISHATTRQWDGKESGYFEEHMSLISKHFSCMKNPEIIALFLLSLPPNIAQAHGPTSLTKMTDYVVESCMTTLFVKEKIAWLDVLAKYFDPHLPDSVSAEETFTLRPKWAAFLHAGGMASLLDILLGCPEVKHHVAVVLHNISRFGNVIPNVTSSEASKRENLYSARQSTYFTFDCMIDCSDILLKFLAAGDLITFGRSFTRGATIVCNFLAERSTRWCKKSNQLQTFMNRMETGLCSLEEKLFEELEGRPLNQAFVIGDPRLPILKQRVSRLIQEFFATRSSAPLLRGSVKTSL